MKKLLTMAAVAAVLACCAPGARAGIGITTNHTPVNISFIVTTNGAYTDKNDVETETSGQAKISNTTLMKIFAHWAGVSSWPAGAKLVIGWDYPWDGDVLVVGSSGTNVLFNADESGHSDTYFYVEFDEYEGPDSYKDIDKDPGSETETEHNYGYIEFEDDYTYLPYTYLYGYGNSTISYTQNWNADGHYTTWTQSTDMANVQYTEEDYVVWMDEYYGSLSGSVSSSGSGKGEAYWY